MGSIISLTPQHLHTHMHTQTTHGLRHPISHPSQPQAIVNSFYCKFKFLIIRDNFATEWAVQCWHWPAVHVRPEAQTQMKRIFSSKKRNLIEIFANFHTITTTWWLPSVMLFVYLLLLLNISVKEVPCVYCLSFCDIWPPPSMTSDTLPVTLSALTVLSPTIEKDPVKDEPVITVVHQSNQLHNSSVNLTEIS